MLIHYHANLTKTLQPNIFIRLRSSLSILYV